MTAKELLGVAMVQLDRTQVLSRRRRLYLVAYQASALLAACAFDLGALLHAFELTRAAALYGQVAEHGPHHFRMVGTAPGAAVGAAAGAAG